MRSGGRRPAGVSAPLQIAAQPQPLVLQVQNLDGKMQWLTDFKGKVVLLNFWSTTCPPCRVETPWFVEFQKRWEKDGFTVVGVSMDDTADAIRKFNAQFGVNYPMLAGRDVEENIQKADGRHLGHADIVLDRP